jgi:hypothetical protein
MILRVGAFQRARDLAVLEQDHGRITDHPEFLALLLRTGRVTA